MRTIRTLDEPWTAKEIPLPILLQMFQVEKDLTGWVLQIRVERDDAEITFNGAVNWSDVTKGIAEITFADGDIDVSADKEYSQYKIEVWSSGGGQRVASVLLKNGCYAHLGTAPTI